MDGRKRGCPPGSGSRQLCVEVLEDKLLLSEFTSFSVALASFSAFRETPMIIARIDDQPGAESQQAPLALQARAIPTSHGSLAISVMSRGSGLYREDEPRGDRMPDQRLLNQVLSTSKQFHPAGISPVSDPDAHRPDQDDDPTTESSERRQLAMLEAVSEATLWAHPVAAMSVWEGGEPNENDFSQLTQERQVQALSLDATRIPAMPASSVNGVEGLVTAASARGAWVRDDLARGAPTLPGAETLINTSEFAGQRSEVMARLLPGHNDTLSLIPLACAPVAGLLPFDLKTLVGGLDRFLAQLTDLGKSWDDPRLAVEVAIWLTTVMAVAFELARIQARKSMCRSFLENSSLSGLTIPLTGDQQ